MKTETPLNQMGPKFLFDTFFFFLITSFYLIHNFTIESKNLVII